ncbi:MAG: PDZ domain-containing protein [Planctomycetaceae bacterium]
MMKAIATFRQITLRLCCFALLVSAVSQPGLAADPKLEELEEQAFNQATALVSPSVVRIQTVGGLDQVGRVLTGTGPTTGVVVSSDGYIISSAFNFISKPASILVQLSDGRRFTAKLVATDHSKMLTLLKIDAKNLVPAQAAAKKSIEVGQWAIALGRTFDGPLPSVSVGIISALDRIWGRAIQTDAKVSPVNYGGPLVNIEGKVQGILVPLSTRGRGRTAGVEWYDSGIGFAIPMEDVYSAVKRLKTGQDLHPGLMGISFKGAGLLGGPPIIDRVRTGSPAAKAGFKVKDRIVEIDGRKIIRQAGVQHALGNKYAGDTVTVTVTRGNETIKKQVTLVDKLIAYESAFLGILPQRELTGLGPKLPGVGIRFVFPNSPAAKANLKPRDRILKFNGQDIANTARLLDLVSRQRPRTKATIVYRRENADKTATVELASIPNTVPLELLPSIVPPVEKKPAAKNAPKTGNFTVTLPKFNREYWALVPESYNPAYKYSVMVWLHPGGDTMEAAMVENWEALCERWNIIIIAPKAGKLGGWTPNDAEFVKSCIENIKETHSTDPSRLFLHGYADGGKFAYQLAFKYRDIVRGVCNVASPLRVRPAENSPEFRLQFHLVCGDKDPVNRLVKSTVAGLRRMKYPVSSATVKDGLHAYPPLEFLDEIARWADCLDRI